MSIEVDVLTPADREAGNPVRLPFKRAAGTAVAVWSRAEGRPAWRAPGSFTRLPAPASPAAPQAPAAYAYAGYFAGDYVG